MPFKKGERSSVKKEEVSDEAPDDDNEANEGDVVEGRPSDEELEDSEEQDEEEEEPETAPTPKGFKPNKPTPTSQPQLDLAALGKQVYDNQQLALKKANELKTFYKSVLDTKVDDVIKGMTGEFSASDISFVLQIKQVQILEGIQEQLAYRNGLVKENKK